MPTDTEGCRLHLTPGCSICLPDLDTYYDEGTKRKARYEQ